MSTTKLIPHSRILEVFDHEPQPLDFIIPGFTRGSVGGLIAPGATGKSTFALQMAIGLAAIHADPLADTLKLCGNQGGKVVLIAAEDPEDALDQRLHALGHYLSPTARNAVVANLVLVPAVGAGLNILDESDYNELLELVQGARLVIIDTLARVHRLDENSAGEASQIMSALERLAKMADCGVMFLHHVNKSSAMNGMADTQQAARGSGVFSDHARWLGYIAVMSKAEAEDLNISVDERKRYVRFGVSKQNYGEPKPDRWYKRQAGGILLPTLEGLHSAVTSPIESKQGTIKPKGQIRSANLLHRMPRQSNDLLGGYTSNDHGCPF